MLIPLDIFRESQQNKGVSEKRDAWLALLSCDEPESVIALIEKYPEFRKIYEEGFEICRNTERVMEMFSKELYELDRNTAQYMMDEMQDTIDEMQNTIDAQKNTIDVQREMLEKTRDKAIRGMVEEFRDLNLPEEQIVTRIRRLYELSDEEMRRYL